MVDYGKVRSTVKPDPIVIDEFSVWVHTDIQPVSENVGTEDEFVGFEFSMKQYGKDEYVKLIDAENKSLNTQITQAQEAMCEIYEMMI